MSTSNDELRFIAEFTHEMRSAIVGIAGNVHEALQIIDLQIDNGLPQATRLRKTLRRAADSAMKAEAVLETARVLRGVVGPARFSPFFLSAALRCATHHIIDRAYARGITVTTHDADIQIDGDQAVITAACFELGVYAVTHSFRGGALVIAAT